MDADYPPEMHTAKLMEALSLGRWVSVWRAGQLFGFTVNQGAANAWQQAGREKD